MQPFLLAAALVAFLVGVVHSILGELLIFRKLRQGSVVPSLPAPPLEPRNVRILWATWHLASAFGFGFAALLLAMANRTLQPSSVVIWSIAGAFLVGSMLVLVATRGRHPGWIGLLAVSALTYLGAA